MSESMSAPLEIWVAEDSPFYRLVVEEAIEEIAKVTYVPISLTVFERFGDIRDAFEQAEQGNQALPAAVLSDLHFPDNAYDDLQDIVAFYDRYLHLVPVSYMSCNPESLKTAQAFALSRLDSIQSARFLRKDTADTMANLVKTIHAMVFTPRAQVLSVGTTLA
ncbi:hypothetical protein [Limnobacter parvus]|uniref:Response regulatory domain-containing protein n=1 Tax=Limnobacter parvus TaxID=2939690 RepID=A0ABT1XJB3_9BURK|nr:hypothetical protein [Limnobacter parvus]MCR2747367.1 hypothetical protein [Limnobacter parvus]